MLQNKSLIVPASSCTPTPFYCIPDIFPTRKKEHEKKMFQTSGHGVSEKHGTMKKKIGTHNGKT